MRRLKHRSFVLLPAFALILTASCNRPQKVQVKAAEEAGPSTGMVVHMADPSVSPQLVRGFHDVEENAWRWTMGKFAVTLKPPVNAAEKGATLQVKFSIPGAVIDKVGPVTLAGNVNGAALLAGETYSKPGSYVYSRDVPASAIGIGAATVEFALDRFLTPGMVDQRELGIVVSSIGFEPK